MENKHAFLIIAHNQFELLEVLLHSLDYEKHDFYLHIDKKAGNIDLVPLYEAVQKGKIFILADRLDVKWGGYSQINCEMRLLEEAVVGNYSYYHLMSGTDMPLKSPYEIYSFFEEHKGTEFVHFEKPEIDQETIKRISKYYLISGKNKPLWGKIINKLFLFLQFGVNRTQNSGLTYQKGANWFSITDELASYVVQNKKIIDKNFKYTVCADEIFLQALVASSKFLSKISPNNFSDNYETIMYCVDWKRGNPYEYTIDDYEELIGNQMLFARKFNWEKDQSIVLKLAMYLQSK